jgi:plasmid stability protein
VETRNITLNLPSSLIRQAKVYAAKHDTTVNALVRQMLEEKLKSEQQTREAVERLLELARRGPHFTKDPGSIRREEIYDRD